MEEVFDSEAFRLRYDCETNACVFTMKIYGERDDFRTPVMHAIEIIRKHKSKHLIIEDSCEGLSDIKEDDLKWMKKVVLPKLQETSCEHIYFVVGDELAGTDCSEVPYSLFAEKFKTDKVVSEQFALMMIKNNCGAEVSSDIVSMTREQALEYLGLPANANDFMIDEKFWKLSKNIRGDNTPEGKQKIADLSAAYDIATGRRDEREHKAEQREQARKIFGKTGDEWRTYFSYTWYKYLILILVLILGGNLIYTIATRQGYDCGYVSIGHFSNDTDFVEKYLTTRLGFRNPMVSTVDIVVPNDQGQTQQAYADQTATTLMLSMPNVLVFDEVTMPYYFGSLQDVTSLYSFLRENLTEEQFSQITPVYMSERTAREILNDYEINYGAEMSVVDDDMSIYDDNPIMVGIKLKNEEAIAALGYQNLWPEYDDSLVFCIYNQTMDINDSEIIIMQLLREVL